MDELKLYSTPGSSYTLSRVDSLQVETHCHQYMDSIAGVLFHGSEVKDLMDSMYLAVDESIAVELSENNRSVAYLYMVPVGKIRHNVIVLHYLVDTPIIRAIMEHEIYSTGSILRYTPKDPIVALHTHLLVPTSTNMFRKCVTPIIRMLRDVPTEKNLVNLNIKEHQWQLVAQIHLI